MRAIYKQHQGFEHLQNYNLPAGHINIDDTSTKKFPNNKYFQFNDEDSSGRKYLKEKLNLYDSHENSFKKCSGEFVSFVEYDAKKKENVNPNIKSSLEKSLTEDEMIYYRPKKEKSKQSKDKNYKTTNKSQSKPKSKKISVHESTLESRCQTKNYAHSSRLFDQQKLEEDETELKYYKKLCVELRKKNKDISKELNCCKEENRQSIQEIQRKIERLSEKEREKNESMNNTKNEKIMESLKAIKGKLSKKETNNTKNDKKFFEFFVESLGILRNEDQESVSSHTHANAQIIWKQILQFLISHDFKLDTKSKTIR